MIPSDHFVRFYNEVFKFLDERNELDAYYERISQGQEDHCLKIFWEKGLAGMFDYWDHIRVEENCILEHEVRDGVYHFHMQICPSLSKIMNNDATSCKKYCNHCQGWVLRVFTRAGFYGVYNVVSLTEPVCHIFATEDKAKAEEILQRLRDDGNPENVLFSNLEFADEIEARKAKRHAGAPCTE